MAKGGLRDVSSGNGGKVRVLGLSSNRRICDVLDESFEPLEAFQRLMEGYELSGDEHQVSALDFATVLQTLTLEVRCRLEERLENPAEAPC